jgi:hypothetical protein
MPNPTAGKDKLNSLDKTLDISVAPTPAMIFSNKAIPTIRQEPKKNNAKTGSCIGMNDFKVIGGKKENILVVRGISFWIDLAGGPIKS